MKYPHGMHVRNTKGIIGIFIIINLSFGCGYAIATINTAIAKTNTSKDVLSSVQNVETDIPSDIHTSADFNEFWDLWRQLKSRYYLQPVDDKKMMYGAMAGLTSAMDDPYTTFFEPKSAEEFATALSGKFEGIGAEISTVDGQLQIISPLIDLPADKAGLKPGDLILKINASSTQDMSTDEAVSYIRGAKGTPVSLFIGRVHITKLPNKTEKKNIETKEYTIIRDAIIVKSVRLIWEKNSIARIQITSFNQDTDDLFLRVVEEILAKNVKGIILDLRNDPGGFLDKATAVAGEWTGDQIVVQERRQGKIVDQLPGTGSGRLKGIPTIILLNQGSASASEIVAGALHDYGMAKIVGMKSFGKGSVQDYSEFPDKSAVKITIAEWLTPKGNSIHKVGIKPDVQVDITQDDLHAKRDSQLDKALELLGAKSAVKTKRIKK